MIGVDGGKGRLIVTLTISNDNSPKPKIKNTAAKKTTVLACVSGIPENYENMAIIVDKLKLNQFSKDIKMVADLKLINILNGLQSSSSTYPCAYGKCKKPTKLSGWVKGEDRTIQNILIDQESWETSTNKNRSQLKNFFNAESKPLITSQPEKRVMDIFPPPPLHLVKLGALNKVYGELGKLVDLEPFEKSINIVKSTYHGGNFEGNECGKILNNITKLEEHVKACDTKYLPFINVIWFLRLIDNIVNLPKLEPGYKEVIESFKDSYKILELEFNVSVTNKVHIITDHLAEYMERNEATLLKTTDQTVECTHSKLDRFLKEHGYFRKNNDNVSSRVKLFNGILAWNSYVLNDKK